MSEASGSSSVNQSSAPAVSSTGSATGAASSSGAGGDSKNWNLKTSVNSVDELRKKAPEIYRAMLEGIAMNMVGQMKRRQDRLKEIMRESRRQAGIK